MSLPLAPAACSKDGGDVDYKKKVPDRQALTGSRRGKKERVKEKERKCVYMCKEMARIKREV